MGDGGPLTPRAALRWPLVRRAVRECQPTSAVEIGCGQGAMGARLARLTEGFVAVEPDPASFAVAKQRIEARGGAVVNGTTEDLPHGQTFDLACAFEVLEHFDDDAAVLVQWATRIRPGGHLLISVPAWQHLYAPWDEAVGHYRRYSPDELRGRLESAGLEPVRISLYGWPLAFALEAMRNRVAGASSEQTGARETTAERTARSGRRLQPSSRLSGVVVDVGILPFRALQRLVPSKGNGIVALARKPA